MDILISGDSWGVGEWGYIEDRYQVLHSGLEYFLTNKGHQVTNVSLGGSSNAGSINRLDSKLHANSFDYVIWFQTSPLRDLRPYKTFEKDYRTYNALKLQSNELLDRSYSNLNNLKTPIHCIGGCSKLNVDLMENYQYLNPLIPSVTEFILKDYTHPEFWIDDWNHCIGTGFDKQSIDKFYDDQKTINLLKTHAPYRTYFWPDGVHPNRHSHKIIFNHVCKSLGIT